MTCQPTTRRRQAGLSLIESLAALAVVSVAAGATIPNFKQAVDKRRLEGAAAQLQTELQFARGLAVARNEPVRFSFQANAASSCYVIHTGSANACQCNSGSTACTAGAKPLRTALFAADSGLRATSNSASFLFDPAKGTVTPTATVEVRSPSGNAVRLVVNIMGRIRTCSPSGLSGYKAC